MAAKQDVLGGMMDWDKRINKALLQLRVRRVPTRPHKLVVSMLAFEPLEKLPHIGIAFRVQLERKASVALRARQYSLMFGPIQQMQDNDAFIRGAIGYMQFAYVHIHNPQTIRRRPRTSIDKS